MSELAPRLLRRCHRVEPRSETAENRDKTEKPRQPSGSVIGPDVRGVVRSGGGGGADTKTQSDNMSSPSGGGASAWTCGDAPAS